MNALEEQVGKYLIARNWKIMKRGWPDYLCIRETTGAPIFPGSPSVRTARWEPGEVIMAIEVKNQKEELSEEQKIVHKILRKAGIYVYVIRPEHLKKKKILHGTFLWSSTNYKTFKYAFESLRHKLNQQTQDLDQLRRHLDEMSIVFDEVFDHPLIEDDELKKEVSGD